MTSIERNILEEIINSNDSLSQTDLRLQLNPVKVSIREKQVLAYMLISKI